MSRIQLHFTSATIVAVIGAAIAVAVSFGAHLSQAQTHNVLILVGLVAAGLIGGGATKTSGEIRSGEAGDTPFHFTSASITAILGAALAAGASFGLHLTPENKGSILTLVGLLAGAITIGGGIKSRAMLTAGIHPSQTRGPGVGGSPVVGRALEPIEPGETGRIVLGTTHEGEPAALSFEPIMRRGHIPARHRPEDDIHPILRVHGTFEGLALGKHLTVKTDARTPQLAEFLTSRPSLGVKMPPEVSRIPALAAELGGDFGMMGNDVRGDCTCAGLGHGLQFWTGVNGVPVTATTAEVLGLYWATGTPTTPGADDSGRVMFDVLKYAHHESLFGHELGAYVGVGLRRWRNRDIKAAVDLFGGCYLGVALPETAQSQSVWDVAGDPNAPGPAQAGSWGGHAIWVPDYSRQGPTCITWGHPQKMTWEFLDHYGDEAYAIIAPDWLRGGKTIQGFDLAALDAYLAKIKTWQPPGS